MADDILEPLRTGQVTQYVTLHGKRAVEIANVVEEAIYERDAEIASLRKQVKVLNAWGTTKTCSSCAAWDVFPADEQPHSTETWGLCRAGLHDTVHGHFCADWEVRHER